MTLPRAILIVYAALFFTCLTWKIASTWSMIGYCPITLLKSSKRTARVISLAMYLGISFYPLAMILSTWLGTIPFFAPVAVFQRKPIHFVGGALLGLATGLFAMSLRALGASWRIGIDPESKSPLITHGIYGVVRHPIYVSMVLMMIGGFLTYASVFSAVAVAMVIPAVHMVAVREERFLHEKLGQLYAEYASRTLRGV